MADRPIPGHECSAFCAGGEHCELTFSAFDHHPVHRAGAGLDAVRRHYDDAYRRRYGARVVRVAPAFEAPGPDRVAAAEPATGLGVVPVAGPAAAATHPWLVWFAAPEGGR